MKRVVVIMFVLFLCACEKRIIPLDIEKKIGQACLVLKNRGSDNAVQAVLTEIDSISNNVARIAYYNSLLDEMLSLDISDIGYHRQYSIVRNIWDLTNKLSYRLKKAGLTIVEAWEAKFRALAWQRKQLERLKPVGPMPKGLALSKGGGLLVLDLEVGKKYRSWRSCYTSIATDYEIYIRHLEGHTFYVDTLRSTEEEKEKLREMLRKYIGRPIRSKEELDRDAKNNTAMEFPYDGWFKGKGPLKF
jgi:hypothetical protein